MKCFFHKKDNSQIIFRKDKYLIKRCLEDGLVFIDQDFDFSYEDYHRDEEYNVSEKQFRNIFQKRVNKILKYKKSGKVLEVGCSTGIYLNLLKENGWEVEGVESSKKAASIAGKKGIKVYQQLFEEVKLPSKSYDLIIFNHTLEHVQDPLNVIKKAYDLLKPGGILIVDLPNFDSLSARVFKGNWSMLLPAEHPWQFVPSTLRMLFEQTGFVDIKFDTSSGIYDYSNPILELSSAFFGLKKRFFHEILNLPLATVERLTNKGTNLSMIGLKR